LKYTIKFIKENSKEKEKRKKKRKSPITFLARPYRNLQENTHFILLHYMVPGAPAAGTRPSLPGRAASADGALAGPCPQGFLPTQLFKQARGRAATVCTLKALAGARLNGRAPA
jgi:hypothetical protein